MGEMDHWESALETLGRFCHPIALELPIFDAGLVDVSVPGLADYVRRFMETLELPPSVVGGNSLGGHVALELALSHPGWVTGLILTGSSGLFERTFTRRVPHRPTAGYVRSRMEEIVEAKHHNVEERLGDIRVPTLIVWGKEDRITPPEVAERFHTHIPGSHLVYLPNCGHAPMLEQPEAFDAAVSEWLVETRARRGSAGGRR
jgi:pimeloyl-ACP methyl ester carboxylesterase